MKKHNDITQEGLDNFYKVNSETFISSEDKKGKCSLCDAKKEKVIAKNGRSYWKYDILIFEQKTHKHKWLKA